MAPTLTQPVLDALAVAKLYTNNALTDASKDLDLDTSLMLHECWNCLHDLEDFFEENGNEDLRSSDAGC